MHAAIVPAAAGAADDDRGVGVRAAKCRREFAGARVDQRRAFGRERARDQSGNGVKNSVARRPRTDQLNARRADRHLADPGRRQDRDVDAAQPFARPPQDRSRAHIATRRQHTLAGRDLRQDLVTAIAHDHGIERRDRVGPRRQRLARIDTHRRRREQRRRIAARVVGRIRRKREAVAQGARRRGNARRGDDIGGEHQPAGARDGGDPRRNRRHQRGDARKHVRQRREPGNPLRGFGFIVHRGSVYRCRVPNAGRDAAPEGGNQFSR